MTPVEHLVAYAFPGVCNVSCIIWDTGLAGIGCKTALADVPNQNLNNLYAFKMSIVLPTLCMPSMTQLA